MLAFVHRPTAKAILSHFYLFLSSQWSYLGVIMSQAARLYR